MAERIEVFLSYAREDQVFAERLFRELKNRKIEVWFDKESLLPDSKWKIEIRKAIRQSRYFIVLLSSKSVTKKGTIQKEIEEALDILDEFPESEIFIIPIRLNDCEPSHEKLRELQWVDIFPDWDKGLEKILKAMNINEVVKYDGLTNAEKEIADLIVEARSIRDRDKSVKTLRKAESECRKLIKEGKPKGYALMTEVLSELARENDLPSKRYEYWKDCLSVAQRAIEKYDDKEFAIVLASKAVDFVQDTFSDITLPEANHLLADARDKIDYFINKKLPASETSRLLSRKASLLRNMCKFRPSRIAQQRISQEAIRCAERAVSEDSESWDAKLELAISNWHIAQFDKADEKYNKRLNSAENSFWESISIKPTIYNLLAISRFFRLTYQTNPCLDCFVRYALIEYNKRRLLQESYIYGEAGVQLWYSNYPEDIVRDYIEDADRLLEESIDAKYGDTRHIIDLAFLKAINGELNVAEDIIHTLHSLSKKMSWTKIAEVVSGTKSSDDLVKKGFALGITESSTWNKLGTFFYNFFQDLDLAVFMHREALRLNPVNAVAMTNLAQRLLNLGTNEAIREADRWISKAASCADRRFRWWRNVRERIQERMTDVSQQPVHKQILKKRSSLKDLPDLYHRYRYLNNVDDPQERGYGLERLVNRLLNVSLVNSFASYRTSLKWINSPRMQIDAGFCFFDQSFYRVETKWTSNPVPPKDIVLFRDKLDVAGVKGLFISISGFTPMAIKKAYELRGERQILLMNGKELKFVLQGSISLDEAIRLKQIYFAKDSNPYYIIKATTQTEVA